jgi:putative chitinase
MQTVSILAASAPTPPPAVTPRDVAQLFPSTPFANIAANLPHILAALAAASLADKPMLLVALATIRAEAESFLPVTEQPCHLNTSPGGHPFDLYDHRHDLGNQGPPDGASFCGRGFVQLTGRANYAQFAREINQPLVTNPALAASPAIAAQLLAVFLSHRQSAIRRALATKDLAAARRLVNGGSNGLARFTSAYTTGMQLISSGAVGS